MTVTFPSVDGPRTEYPHSVDRLLDERSADWHHGFGSLGGEAAAELERVVAEQRS